MAEVIISITVKYRVLSIASNFIASFTNVGPYSVQIRGPDLRLPSFLSLTFRRLTMSFCVYSDGQYTRRKSRRTRKMLLEMWHTKFV